jgi:hypothetical protein
LDLTVVLGAKNRFTAGQLFIICSSSCQLSLVLLIAWQQLFNSSSTAADSMDLEIQTFKQFSAYQICVLKAWCKENDVYKHYKSLHCPKNKADFQENKGGSPLEGKFSSNPWK